VRPGQSPHGKYHEVYINKTLRDALPSATNKAPVGSIIVKENLDSSRKLTKISVMVKVEGFNPSAGDWWWANFDGSGKTTASGVVKGCIACHEGMKDNDYVIIRRLSEPLPPAP
jgi:hypothetical protein